MTIDNRFNQKAHEIISNLLPIADYFITVVDEEGSESTLELMRTDRLFSVPFDKEIILIEQRNLDVKYPIWAKSTGWDKEAYEERVFTFSNLLVGPSDIEKGHHITTSYDDQCTPMEAASSFSYGDDVEFDIVPHCGSWCLYSVDIEGKKSLHNACFYYEIKNGDIFNGYHSKSRKSGYTWNKDLLTSIEIELD